MTYYIFHVIIDFEECTTVLRSWEMGMFVSIDEARCGILVEDLVQVFAVEKVLKDTVLEAPKLDHLNRIVDELGFGEVHECTTVRVAGITPLELELR